MWFRNTHHLPREYWLLVAARIALVFPPQSGYIHPDEFFQTVEIYIGKIFNVDYRESWEFEPNMAIRSTPLLSYTIGITYEVIKLFNNYTDYYFNINLISPYILLVSSRLLVCLLSFLVDYSLLKICEVNREPFHSRLFILASSHIMLIYGSRTFTNTFEMIIFSLLLYYISESMVLSMKLTEIREWLNRRYMDSRTPIEKAIYHKHRLFLLWDSLKSCAEISVLLTLGFFNRPTFLAFAAAPVFFWLYRGIPSRLTIKLNFSLRMITLAVCCIPTFIFIIIHDSFFYGYLSWNDIGQMQITFNNFVFTPWNFIRYNLNGRNLAQHGLHPFYVHAIINLPLLFNVLFFYALIEFSSDFLLLMRGRYHLLPSTTSIKGMMSATLYAPVLLFSMVPHQEPRFLIPLIVPLIYLHGEQIYRECIPGDGDHNTNGQKFLLRIWLYINLVCVLFYGVIHQGGVYGATKYLSNTLKQYPLSSNLHCYVFNSHTYTIPQSLLLEPSSKTMYRQSNGTEYTLEKRVHIHEMGSNSLYGLTERMYNVIHGEEQRAQKSMKKSKRLYYVLIPQTKLNEMHSMTSKVNLTFHHVNGFGPHFSMEAPPYLVPFYTEIFYGIINMDFNSLYHAFHELISNFTLRLVAVQIIN